MAADSLIPGQPAPGPALTSPRIVIAIGFPGSGKSTWFERCNIRPLSSDQIRRMLFDDETDQRFQSEVFEAVQALLRARLRIGMPVSYVDATNLARAWRRPYVDIAREFGSELEALFFDVPLEVCLTRNAGRERRVPEEAMRYLAEKFEPPSLEEGFDRITVIGVEGQTLREISAVKHRT